MFHFFEVIVKDIIFLRYNYGFCKHIYLKYL